MYSARPLFQSGTRRGRLQPLLSVPSSALRLRAASTRRPPPSLRHHSTSCSVLHPDSRSFFSLSLNSLKPSQFLLNPLAHSTPILSAHLYRCFKMNNRFKEETDCIIGELNVAQEVCNALSLGKPVVALESTIISHGMPYPQNLHTAKEVESIVRNKGAIPATIAILDGVPCIGLDNEQLEKLANLGTKAHKTARRDIPHVIATKENGATTVSATMFFASKVGIPIFVTGGIGGVHRYAEETMDISSDLTELGRTAVAVISAGVKSILDIPKTLEYLETQGVTVAAYRTNEFPAFFSGSSGCKVSCRVDTPEDCARLIYANTKLGLGSGLLFAVPIPEEHMDSGNAIKSAIQEALEEAKTKNVTGSAATPFLLKRVNELTRGLSLAANIALIKNNALVGTDIAIAFANLRRSLSYSPPRSAL